jgi:predicted house-cleaning NTP pyrophosphatase (Maf/HAM1 superfamily)
MASLWIEGLDGDYFNVVGLPVKLLHDKLISDFGIDPAPLLFQRINKELL